MRVNVKALKGRFDRGYALDKHSLLSTPRGHDAFGHLQWNTRRSEVGEALYQFKYRSQQHHVVPLSGQTTPHIVSLHGAPVRYASAQVFALHDRAGRAVGKAFMLRDITHEKNIERQLQRINEELEWTVQQRTQALHQAKTMLQTVLNVMPSLVAYWDRHLINHFANAAYERAFQREAGQLNGVYMPDLVGPALFEKALPHIKGVLADRKSVV